MNVIKCDSIKSVYDNAERLSRVDDIYYSGVSVSFRVYDKFGDTIEIYIFYK